MLSAPFFSLIVKFYILSKHPSLLFPNRVYLLGILQNEEIFHLETLNSFQIFNIIFEYKGVLLFKNIYSSQVA